MSYKTKQQRQQEAIERKRRLAENYLRRVTLYEGEAVRAIPFYPEKCDYRLALALEYAYQFYMTATECGESHNEAVATVAAALTGKPASALFGLPFRAFEEVLRKSKVKSWSQIVSEDREHLINVFLSNR